MYQFSRGMSYPATHVNLNSNGRQTVGDGAFTFDNEPNVLALCHLQGTGNLYYATFSGGPGVSTISLVISLMSAS